MRTEPQPLEERDLVRPHPVFGVHQRRLIGRCLRLLPVQVRGRPPAHLHQPIQLSHALVGRREVLARDRNQILVEDDAQVCLRDVEGDGLLHPRERQVRRGAIGQRRLQSRDVGEAVEQVERAAHLIAQVPEARLRRPDGQGTEQRVARVLVDPAARAEVGKKLPVALEDDDTRQSRRVLREEHRSRAADREVHRAVEGQRE